MAQQIRPMFELEDMGEHTYTRRVATKTDTGIEYKDVEEPMGQMLYSPQGHSVHIPNSKSLKHLRLEDKGGLIDWETGDKVADVGDVSLKTLVERNTQPPRRRAAKGVE